ncbi:ACP S-malonyltransferase [bacterium]|nr:ACP S-malonyltransferase [bacterium]MBU1637191.1 ACP S-malonyltransferase [bacterium]MBU1921400.1 ACP S-malonyltransferase [bacterium]
MGRRGCPILILKSPFSTLSSIFLYPGQGSQAIGMGHDLYEKYSLARDRYAQAAGILGFDLAKVCFEASDDELKQTRVTQPALYVHSCILTELLARHNLQPEAAAGHSLGEYSALQAAGAFSFEDGLRLVKVRAEAMQHAGEVNPGTMAAVIGLDETGVLNLCQSVSEMGIAVPANFNSPGQVVVSGDVSAIEAVIAGAKTAGARMAKQLVVSGAFHSPLMQPAADALTEALASVEIKEPAFPVMSNVTASAHGKPPEIKELLAKQLLSPVRWTGCMNSLASLSAPLWYEVGSGNVLSGLLKRTISGASAMVVNGVGELEKLQLSTGTSA